MRYSLRSGSFRKKKCCKHILPNYMALYFIISLVNIQMTLLNHLANPTKNRHFSKLLIENNLCSWISLRTNLTPTACVLNDIICFITTKYVRLDTIAMSTNTFHYLIKGIKLRTNLIRIYCTASLQIWLAF